MGTIVQLTVDGSPMELYVSVPASEQRTGAGIVLLHDQHGLAEFTFTYVEKLAEQGYAVAAPDNFHHRPKDEELQTKKANLNDRYIINDIGAAVDWLCEHGGADRERIGILGFCQGGRMTFLGASTDHRLRAAVVLYGGNMFIARGEGPTPFERLKDIRCPVLSLNGERDTNPSPSDMLRIKRELEAHNVPHEFHSFPTAGHAFANHLLPKYYDPEATAKAWPMALAFLRKHLS